MRITEVVSTDLFAGSAARPLQIVRVTLVNDGPGMISDPAGQVTVGVHGAGVVTPGPVMVTKLHHGEQRTIEVPVEIAAPAAPGSARRVTAVAQSATGHWQVSGQIAVAEPGWTMWMVSHFHYDPVWWNTQGQYTQTWPLLPATDGSLPEVRTAFELMRLHLQEARRDPHYKFVLAEIDYLKPYFDAHPEDRADLLAFIAEGRIEIVGGNYNEPNTNLTCAESTIRNAVYGMAFQNGVLGATPTAAWMLDAFGFDPSYPGLMAAAGLAESSWARGPFHQWGPEKIFGGNKRMQFPADFEWISPDGHGLLTSYMPNHYSAGWITQHAADLATAEKDAYSQFRSLAPVAATRNVLLPVGGDHVVPSRWATAIHRDWNTRYVWPRFVTAVPREFFEAVRAERESTGAWLMPQTRDMNPVYPGKDVTYIDTKQAQRDGEIALLDGERLATAAWLAGAPYPVASLDKAWRLLAFGAHHDAITGTEGDQVYLDLLAGWREAFDRGAAARDEAAAYLAGQADTASVTGAEPGPGEHQPRAVVVFNTLAWPRSGLATISLHFAEGECAGVTLTDQSGDDVACLADGIARHGDGSLAAATLTFVAADVPPLGYKTFVARISEPGHDSAAGTRTPESCGWQPMSGVMIQNDAFTVRAGGVDDGSLESIVDRRTGIELLAGAGNELVIQEEYPTHPRWGEGPWLLCPKGRWRGPSDRHAKVRAERCPVATRLVTEYACDELQITQETLLWDDSDVIEFRTHVDGSIGHDRLLRVRFATNVPGGLPIYQTGLSVIGRPFGDAEIDVAEHTYTLDNPAHEWFGVGSTARICLTGQAGERRMHAIGVAEVIAPADAATDGFAPRDTGAGSDCREEVRALLVALAAQGVTATCSVPEGPRYGAAELDSNLPDIRIALGGPDKNDFTAQVLAAAGPAVTDRFETQMAETGSARIWIPAARSRRDVFLPGADLRGSSDLPVLIVAGTDLRAAIAAVTDDLSDALVEAPWSDYSWSDEPGLATHTVALLNRGLPGSLVTPAGDACISLMRACSAWPSGTWMDGEKRTVPDGSSFAWQHWSHTFEYALASGSGDWRTAGFPVSGQEYSHRLLAYETDLHAGPLPAEKCLVSVTPAGVDVMALKPRGNPIAPLAQPDPADGVTLRLRDVTGRNGRTTAAVRLFTGASAATVTSLLEDNEIQPAGGADGAVTAVVPARGTVTLAITPAQINASGNAAGSLASASPESAQPVFSRYWLHGKGPAPAGNMPVAVHISPGRLAVQPGSDARIRVTVACGLQPAVGTVLLDVPAALELASATWAGPARDQEGEGQDAEPGKLPFRLAAGGYAAWDVVVHVPARAEHARQFIAARLIDDAGQLVEDVAVLAVGEPEPPAPTIPLDQLLPALETISLAEAAEATLTMVSGHIDLPPGGSGTVTARLSNTTASEIRGEAQLISPHGSWSALKSWTTGFATDPDGETELSFGVAIPREARPGQRWWALVKVMYFGRLRYSQPIWITVKADSESPIV
ncbi:MAG TPA: glycoside hydrolase family 38 C-terminal domain-containing protein [Streptosporangiaceae bacterium]|nr:glycoside hydrolase family 38 C-terminal domain-containing protein [Streptosporangiaceae bacterium]